MAYCSTRTMTEWGMAFRRHRSVADASCLSCHGKRWPHDSIDPGWHTRSRAGVGAGGVSPRSSLVGSFIFFVASTACPHARRAASMLALALRVCGASAEPCGLAFALPALALVAKAYFCVSMYAVTLPAA